jgi:carboxypeptidase family protein
MRVFTKVAFVLSWTLLTPAVALAQASIAGVARDTSGAVLPGVTVEAASPVLIEKVRTAITDGNGRYEIIDLRPGVYVVSASLEGFNTFKREGVVLGGAGTVTVDAEMRLGTIQETVTVTADAPVVDVASVTRQTVLDQEAISMLPTSRNYGNFGRLATAVVTNRTDDVGGVLGDPMPSLSVHGSRNVDQRITLNGVNTSTLQAGGNIGGATPDVGTAAEVTIDTAAVNADLPTGGVRINFIPRDGGNTFASSNFFSFANESMVGDNVTDRLRALGIRTPDKVIRNVDLNLTFGGPIVRDRFWFWASGRHTIADSQPAGVFFNKNAYDVTKWTYVPDTSREAPQNKGVWHSLQFRGTIQANAKNKIAFTWREQNYCRCPDRVSDTLAPEAAQDRRFPRLQQQHVEWTSPLTNRILVEAVGMHFYERWGNMHPRVSDGNFFFPGGSLTDPAQAEALHNLIPVLEQSTGMLYRGGNADNANVNNNYWRNTSVPNYFYRAAISYVTGTHNVKAGFNRVHGYLQQNFYQFQPYTYRFNNEVPNLVTIWATPYGNRANLDNDLGLFAQDRWTLDRWTVHGGLRFDMFQSSFPEQRIGPGLLVPNRDLVFPAQDNLDWKDITYRSGAAWDVFGTGKTAVKITLNKYLQGQGLNALAIDPAPGNLLVQNANRSWNDSFYGPGDPRTGNFAPDCVLDARVPGANGECGPLSNTDFGALSSRPAATFSKDLMTGWGHRAYNWEFSTSVQHEIVPRVSVDVGYFRRMFGNFRVIDDLSVSPDDFDTFSITAPTDSRLGENSGQQLTGLYNLKPGAFGRPVRNYNTLSDEYGKMTEHWNGVDMTVAARLENGLTAQGGISTGRRSMNRCDIYSKLPEMLLGVTDSGTNLGNDNNNVWLPAQWCDQAEPFLTSVRFLGSYIVPRLDVLVSATYQNSPGPLVAANFVATNAYLAANSTLGRALAGAQPNMTINMVEPGSLFVERLSQLDFRVGKVIRYGRTRSTINLDIFNALNTDAIRAINNAYASWIGPGYRPSGVLLPRFFKISATFDY